jgi:3-hydroxyisobutyrate dehydrogenase-like beta-hydroxyacid dehydrogenase
VGLSDVPSRAKQTGTVSVCIGVVSPGAMGSALGYAWRRGGARVVATVAGRSARTAALAADAGLELLPDLDAVVRAAEIVVSVGPPDQAPDIAGQIAESARRQHVAPLVADLNAISPATVERIAAICTTAGLDFVDGAISGAPPRDGVHTIAYLSGPSARRLADRDAPNLDARVVGVRRGQASAVKMCTASVYKGFTALLVQAMLTAREHDCVDVVLADLADEFAGLDERLARQLAMAASKAQRWVGEMREIAATQAAAGARPELFEAMADVWTRVSRSRLAGVTPEQAASARPLSKVLADLAALAALAE